jgi:hypothetical protein
MTVVSKALHAYFILEYPPQAFVSIVKAKDFFGKVPAYMFLLEIYQTLYHFY